ncbi:helix-turn-helix domain-containing protein [Cytobacillus suaedae]|nr:helix-turn-helix domain-containing protein [Cytobacillus suaedae]
MIEKLKNLYKDSFTVSNTGGDPSYVWFISDTGSIFGIKKNAISEKEISLLHTLFEPYEPESTSQTAEQSLWSEFLFSTEGSNSETPQCFFNRCRFIHFKISKPITDLQNFELAVKALFPSEVIIVWENGQQGTFIEKINQDSMIEYSNLEDVIEIFASDFYIDVHLFIGNVYELSSNVQSRFHFEKNGFNTALKYIHKQRVYSLQDIIPIFILENMDISSKNDISYILKETFNEEKEQLETIKVFLESNLNVTLAAKKLYMHRNSLQYRIDKFIEKTGIDIKNFNGAVTAYLSILLIKHFEDSDL